MLGRSFSDLRLAWKLPASFGKPSHAYVAYHLCFGPFLIITNNKYYSIHVFIKCCITFAFWFVLIITNKIFYSIHVLIKYWPQNCVICFVHYRYLFIASSNFYFKKYEIRGSFKLFSFRLHFLYCCSHKSNKFFQEKKEGWVTKQWEIQCTCKYTISVRFQLKKEKKVWSFKQSVMYLWEKIMTCDL